MTHGDLLDLARTVAEEAAALVRRQRHGGVAVADTKSSPTDIVTAVDRDAEELIHRRITETRPGDGFLGEEGASTESTTGVTWVVDPIDGTVNFLYGIPQYAISIAAVVDDESVAGVVTNVVTGECFTAVRGEGAWCDDEPLAVRDAVPMSQALVGTGFSYERDVRMLQALAVSRMLGHVRDVRRLGSAALDLCFVGAGRLDAYVEEGLNPWDMAAGGLVASEAGARLETRRGVGGKTCVVAAPGAVFDEFEKLASSCGFFSADGE
ncbi:MAG TPA: inositol monophosphatase family protein [Nocardioidaceae bacterium]|nr:inositol monophosphatase family protein [Nocardioidaceae bacterium]